MAGTEEWIFSLEGEQDEIDVILCPDVCDYGFSVFIMQHGSLDRQKSAGPHSQFENALYELSAV